MGEVEDDWASRQEGDAFCRTPSELEQEAYDGSEEEDENEFDEELDRYIDSTVRSNSALCRGGYKTDP